MAEGSPGSAARALARDALVRIESEGAYANIVVPALLDASTLSERDRGFVTDLVYGTTRMRRACDAAIDPHLKSSVETVVRTILRLGAYQLLFADVAPHAAVSATVDVTPKRAQGFVNAVLRRVAEAGTPTWPDCATELSYPDWIVARLTDDLGDDGVAALEAMNRPSTPERRPDGYVQDKASQWVAELVGVQPGQRVADVCAAPGGKATALGHDAGPGGIVAALDVRPARAGLIAANVRSTGAGAVAPVVGDATTPPLRRGVFDRVLVDAPCSGLGVLHRRADARWRVEPADVAAMASGAKAMLAAAAPLVAPDGVLVFSVCTLASAETVAVAAWAVSRLPGFTPLAPPSSPWRAHGHGALLLPQAAGTDGMFILRLRRASAARSGGDPTMPPHA